MDKTFLSFKLEDVTTIYSVAAMHSKFGHKKNLFCKSLNNQAISIPFHLYLKTNISQLLENVSLLNGLIVGWNHPLSNITVT